MRTYTCTHCGETKEIGGFYFATKIRNGKSRRYRRTCCIQCWTRRGFARRAEKARESNDRLIAQVEAMLKKFGPMTTNDLARMINDGRSGRSISRVIMYSPKFIAFGQSKHAWLWAVPGYEIRRNRSQKRRIMTGPNVTPIYIGAARPPIIVPEKRPIQAAPSPPPQPPMQPQWHQPEHDAWYAALQAEVAARKAAQAAMRGRV